MLITLSPAKTLNFEPQPIIEERTTPELLKESRKIIKEMRSFDVAGLENLMGISTELAEQNVKRFKQWKTCLLYTSPSPRDKRQSRMPSSA